MLFDLGGARESRARASLHGLALHVLLAASLATLPACGAPAEAPLPCDVSSVLHGVCDVCHSSPPQNGAPISLVTYADTQVSYTALPTYDHVPTWKVIGDAVQSGSMPQPWPGLTFSADQRQTLRGWVAAGAPAAPADAVCP